MTIIVSNGLIWDKSVIIVTFLKQVPTFFLRLIVLHNTVG